jgi:hypothetical protein
MFKEVVRMPALVEVNNSCKGLRIIADYKMLEEIMRILLEKVNLTKECDLLHETAMKSRK